MKYLLFLFFCCSFHLAQAQDLVNRDNGSPEAQEVIKELERAAFYRDIGEAKNAKKIAGKALKLAGRIKDQELRALAIYEEAMALKEMAKHTYINKGLALAKFQKSFELLEENDIDNESLLAENENQIESIIEFFEDSFEGELKIDPLRIRIEKDDNSKLEIVMNELADELSDLNINVVTDGDFPEVGTSGEGSIPPTESSSSSSSSETTTTTSTTSSIAIPLPTPISPQHPEAPEVDVKINRILKLQKEEAEDEFNENLEDDLTEVLEPDSKLEEKDIPKFDNIWRLEEKALKMQFEKEESKLEKMAPQNIKNGYLLALFQHQVDSLTHLRQMDSILLDKNRIELEMQEADQALLVANRKILNIGVGSGVMLLLFLLWGYRKQKKNNRKLSQQNHLVLEEKKRSEDLLLNILPAQVAKELKAHGAASAHKYDNVSVLFSDFKNFSKLAEKVSPVELVSELDYCFRNFDRIIEKYRLEKIKTIGDAYMCAGGFHTKTNDHLNRIINAGLEMQEFLAKWKVERMAKNEPYLEARIGIHTGPVVAGVVGAIKFAYDIWGDTVNIAARMETHGEPGKVNVSGTVYDQVKNQFEFIPRGEITVKNHKTFEMFFIKERNPKTPEKEPIPHELIS